MKKFICTVLVSTSFFLSAAENPNQLPGTRGRHKSLGDTGAALPAATQEKYFPDGRPRTSSASYAMAQARNKLQDDIHKDALVLDVSGKISPRRNSQPLGGPNS